jgi:hypothetical protein
MNDSGVKSVEERGEIKISRKGLRLNLDVERQPS